ncbi:UNVERIFIED_CONTAM: hypothetical protein GTU68_052018 [Idotea baltica]|nr:hypothetical protein [Idotea baltica]
MSPMPGRVLDILVKEGDQVQAGDHLIILEAMKMENVLKANHDSIIEQVMVQRGDAVEKNMLLIEFDQ